MGAVRYRLQGSIRGRYLSDCMRCEYVETERGLPRSSFREYYIFVYDRGMIAMTPCILEGERLEIVKAIRYVDEAVIVDYHNADTKNAWELYQFNVQFCGDDHEKELQGTKRYLQSLGANMVFFPYTMSTSSTKIKEKIKGLGN